jgi:hypothetical protein
MRKLIKKYYSELLGFWTLSIVGNSKARKHNVSETGFFRPQVKGGRHLLCWVP